MSDRPIIDRKRDVSENTVRDKVTVIRIIKVLLGNRKETELSGTFLSHHN